MGKFSANIRKFIGNYDYNHSGASQALASGSWQHLLNDANGAYTDVSNGVTDIANVYDSATNQFDFSSLKIGDLVIIRFTVEYDILTPNTAIGARMNMAVGDASNYQIQIRPESNFKTAQSTLLTSSIEISMDNQFTIDNPAQVEVDVENATNVGVNGWKVFVFKRSL